MSELRIYTNKVPRNLCYWDEIPDKIQSDFDWIEDPWQEGFVRYKGNYYAFSEFMRTKGTEFSPFWHGYTTDSAFSGTLIHLCEDADKVIMGWYCSCC